MSTNPPAAAPAAPPASDLPTGPNGPAVVTNATSGNQANAAANATLAAAAGRLTFITGFEVTGLGATAAATVIVSLGTVAGGINLQYVLAVPAGVTTPITPLIVEFPKPIPANALGSTMGINVPAFGAGNTNVIANVHGYIL